MPNLASQLLPTGYCCGNPNIHMWWKDHGILGVASTCMRKHKVPISFYMCRVSYDLVIILTKKINNWFILWCLVLRLENNLLSFGVACFRAFSFSKTSVAWRLRSSIWASFRHTRFLGWNVHGLLHLGVGSSEMFCTC